MANITQIVNSDESMLIFKKIVTASGLDMILSSTGPFTVFAATDPAFKKSDKELFSTLLMPENKTKLTDVLNYHVVSGTILFKNFKDGEKLKQLMARNCGCR